MTQKANIIVSHAANSDQAEDLIVRENMARGLRERFRVQLLKDSSLLSGNSSLSHLLDSANALLDAITTISKLEYPHFREILWRACVHGGKCYLEFVDVARKFEDKIYSMQVHSMMDLGTIDDIAKLYSINHYDVLSANARLHDTMRYLLEQISKIVEVSISGTETGSEKQLWSATEKLSYLDSIFYNDEGLIPSKLILSLFPVIKGELEAGESDVHPDIRAVRMPSVAPFFWKSDRIQVTHGLSNARRLENPPEFIRRVYAEWLGKGLDRAHIRNFDPALSQALDNWLRTNAMPTDIDLPTRKEQSLRWIDRIEREGVSAIAGVDTDSVLRDAQRLLLAKQRRDRQ